MAHQDRQKQYERAVKEVVYLNLQRMRIMTACVNPPSNYQLSLANKHYDKLIYVADLIVFEQDKIFVIFNDL